MCLAPAGTPGSGTATPVGGATSAIANKTNTSPLTLSMAGLLNSPNKAINPGAVTPPKPGTSLNSPSPSTTAAMAPYQAGNTLLGQ